MKKKINCDDDSLNVLELCAGAGGQALGLEQAGFNCIGAVENDPNACETLRVNRPEWNVSEMDIRKLSGKDYKGVDLIAGGVPCPPFSIAGKQLGEKDERDLFPEALRVIAEAKPKAIMLENVRGLSAPRFEKYRQDLFEKLTELKYKWVWNVLNASDYGVPQLRPRFILVALKTKYASYFEWPEPDKNQIFVGDAIGDLLSSNGWEGVEHWKNKANLIAPTLVGGSKKHGGADLGPTRAKAKWAELGIDGHGIANEVPDQNFPLKKMPKLTLEMTARIQGFPDFWKFSGKKTAAYRQIGNAFPPPVAKAVGTSIKNALLMKKKIKRINGQAKFFGVFELMR